MLDSRINQNFNRPIASPQFRANENVTKLAEVEEKKGLSNGAKWAIGLGLTALASYGIYYALTKGRVKGVKPTPKPENPITEIKEMAIDAFKRGKDATKEGVNRLVKGKAILADGTMYTGNITSTGKDGSKVVMEYVDGVLQKSTKTAKDGTKVFDKAYTWAEDGLIKEIKKNGETILDENKLIEIYKKANTELLRKDSLEGRFPNVIKNLEEIYADLNKIENVDFRNSQLHELRRVLSLYGFKFDDAGKIIKKTTSTNNIQEGLINLRNQNKELLNNLKIEKKLGNDYTNLMLFYQDLDVICTDKHIVNNKTVQNVRKKVETILDNLGYKFKDFDPKNYSEFYDVEKYSIDEIDLVSRAIIDKNGKTIAKGKVYVPENF